MANLWLGKVWRYWVPMSGYAQQYFELRLKINFSLRQIFSSVINDKSVKLTYQRSNTMNAPVNLPEGMRPAHGLYDPRNEHDACGIGLYANIHNKKSHEIVSKGLEILHNLEHRGAVGADPKAGDGAGILIQIPHEFFAADAKQLGFDLPASGQIWRGLSFYAARACLSRRH
jgi:Glutamine amidotransferases class-II